MVQVPQTPAPAATAPVATEVQAGSLLRGSFPVAIHSSRANIRASDLRNRAQVVTT
jgi:hypothetical protein